MDIRALVAEAIREDVGPGDVTTLACVSPASSGVGVIRAKQALVVCGHETAREVFAQVGEHLGESVDYEITAADGSHVMPGTEIASIRGALRTLLVAERIALNFLMRLSGIATHTRAFLLAAGEHSIRVVDTRKTTPLHRAMERRAVRIGGGHNHRFALYDGILIKDNHIRAAGSITDAVRRARARTHHLLKIEVEIEALAQLDEAIEAGADAVMLDNMDDGTMRRAVEVIRTKAPHVRIEASGNITAERIGPLAALGVDMVSVGGLIHQARWVDLSLRLR